jgi:two-component system, LytTR family, response regulator
LSDPRKLRAVIVDDEPPARALLREYLAALGDVEVVAECSDGFAAVAAVTEHDPDLLLLDIQMPQLSGFEVLEALDRSVATVFITAFDTHAVRAFEVHAVDYLLKPFGVERLRLAVARARARAGSGAAPAPAGLAAAARPAGVPMSRIVVRDGGRVVVVPTAELDWIEAADDYVILHTGGKTYRKQQTLTELEAQLDPERFVRAHRSIVLNIARVSAIETYAKDSRIAVLRDGTKVPVSRSGYARARQVLDGRTGA